jgi:hypothetical protein
MQGHTTSLPRHHRDTRSGRLSSSLWLEHRAPLHEECLPIETSSKTTPRLGAVYARTLPLRLAASAWWVLPGHLLRTSLADTQLLGYLKRPMRRHQVTESFEISIQTSMLFGSRPSWSRSNAWYHRTPT